MPHSLSAMVAMILNGPNFKSQGCDGVSQASISIAQLLQYHISVRRRPGSTGIYHQNTGETPLPIYVCTNSKVNIDEARQELFTMKGKSMDAIPPTRAALLQHIRRAVVYQGGHCWGKMLQATIGMPPPGDWGWVNPQNWRPMLRLVLLQGN